MYYGIKEAVAVDGGLAASADALSSESGGHGDASTGREERADDD